MSMGAIIRIVIYSTVLLVMIILIIMARHESTFIGKERRPLVPIRRAAVYVYKRVLRHRTGGHGRFTDHILLSEQARTDIAVLHGSGQSDRSTLIYLIDKVQTMLTCTMLGAVFGILLVVQSQQKHTLQGIAIDRPQYGTGDMEIRLAGTADGISSEYDVMISERQYTSEETETLFSALVSVLPERIRGSNEDLLHVRSNLSLRSSYEDYPFRLSYSSSNYTMLHDDGTVCNEELADTETVDVTLSIKAVYKGRVYRTQIPVMILPVVRSLTDQFTDAVQNALADADANTIYGRTLYLPEWINGTYMEWSEPVRDQSLLLFLLILFAGGVHCYIRDRELREQVTRRERQMSIDYPQVVSKVTLFLGAGMSVRNVFYKLSNDYRSELENGGEVHYVYEEIVLMCRELDSGASEMSAYRNLAARCRLRSYTKFISLLTQNLQKGNSTLLAALEEEAAAAFEERKSIARQLGEEAGTKMLLPMMLMLIITLVIIVVPAYLGFV